MLWFSSAALTSSFVDLHDNFKVKRRRVLPHVHIIDVYNHWTEQSVTSAIGLFLYGRLWEFSFLEPAGIFCLEHEHGGVMLSRGYTVNDPHWSVCVRLCTTFLLAYEDKSPGIQTYRRNPTLQTVTGCLTKFLDRPSSAGRDLRKNIKRISSKNSRLVFLVAIDNSNNEIHTNRWPNHFTDAWKLIFFLLKKTYLDGNLTNIQNLAGFTLISEVLGQSQSHRV